MSQSPQHFAIVGAGMAGLTCARTLLQAGQRVTLFEQADAVGGRMATCETPFGGFDTACQYFTVRDPRFEQALQSSPGLCKPWSANSVSLLDAHGRISAHAADAHEPHWVPVPTMQALPQHWAEPLRTAGRLHLCCRVERLEVDDSAGARWRLRVRGPDALSRVEAGFDGVLLAATCQAARRKAWLVVTATPGTPSEGSTPPT